MVRSARVGVQRTFLKHTLPEMVGDNRDWCCTRVLRDRANNEQASYSEFHAARCLFALRVRTGTSVCADVDITCRCQLHQQTFLFSPHPRHLHLPLTTSLSIHRFRRAPLQNQSHPCPSNPPQNSLSEFCVASLRVTPRQHHEMRSAVSRHPVSCIIKPVTNHNPPSTPRPRGPDRAPRPPFQGLQKCVIDM